MPIRDIRGVFICQGQQYSLTIYCVRVMPVLWVCIEFSPQNMELVNYSTDIKLINLETGSSMQPRCLGKSCVSDGEE